MAAALSERAARRRWRQGPSSPLEPWRELLPGACVIGFSSPTHLPGTCCSHRKAPARTSLPAQGYKEAFSLPMGKPHRSRRPTGFFAMPCALCRHALLPSPPRPASSLLQCSGDVDGHGTDLSVFPVCRDLLVLARWRLSVDGGCRPATAGLRGSSPRCIARLVIALPCTGLLLVPVRTCWTWAQPNPQGRRPNGALLVAKGSAAGR